MVLMARVSSSSTSTVAVSEVGWKLFMSLSRVWASKSSASGSISVPRKASTACTAAVYSSLVSL